MQAISSLNPGAIKTQSCAEVNISKPEIYSLLFKLFPLPFQLSTQQGKDKENEEVQKSRITRKLLHYM